MVSRLLIRPLKRLQRAVSGYRPGDSELSLPQKVGPSREIQELRDAFARAVARVEQSENDMGEALEGQRLGLAGGSHDPIARVTPFGPGGNGR